MISRASVILLDFGTTSIDVEWNKSTVCSPGLIITQWIPVDSNNHGLPRFYDPERDASRDPNPSVVPRK
jgi:hypothetical protein